MSPRVACGRWSRTWHWLGLVAIGAVLAWQLAAELIEPYLLLVVADWLTPKAPPLELATVGQY